MVGDRADAALLAAYSRLKRIAGPQDVPDRKALWESFKVPSAEAAEWGGPPRVVSLGAGGGRLISRLQRHFTHLADKAALGVLQEQLRRRAEGGIRQAWVQRIRLQDCAGFLGPWLLATPRRSLRIPAAAFRARLCWQIGMAPPGLPTDCQTCMCRRFTGDKGDLDLHLPVCKAAGLYSTTDRHNIFARVLGEIERAAFTRVRHEAKFSHPEIQINRNTGRPANAPAGNASAEEEGYGDGINGAAHEVDEDADRGRGRTLKSTTVDNFYTTPAGDVAVDVMITDPTAAGRISPPARHGRVLPAIAHPAVAVRQAQNSKRRRYGWLLKAGVFKGCSFKPVVVTVGGTCTEVAHKYINSTAQAAAERASLASGTPIGALKSWYLQTLRIALAGAHGRLLAQRVRKLRVWQQSQPRQCIHIKGSPFASGSSEAVSKRARLTKKLAWPGRAAEIWDLGAKNWAEASANQGDLAVLRLAGVFPPPGSSFARSSGFSSDSDSWSSDSGDGDGDGARVAARTGTGTSPAPGIAAAATNNPARGSWALGAGLLWRPGVRAQEA